MIHSPEMPDWTRRGHALRRRRSGILVPLALVLLGLAAVWLLTWLDPLPARISGRAVAVDGDTLRLGEDRIRLLGIDAPELDQACQNGSGGKWRCGLEARNTLTTIVRTGEIDCQPYRLDIYGRWLARCWRGEEDLAASLMSAGMAISRNAYRDEENTARTARLGVWQGPFIDPGAWRKDKRDDASDTGGLESIWTWLRELTGARTLR